ncbi:DUF2316 family protein [Paraclostridium sordellii]|uniref:DUF2316 family protein n=1 Tax=Paraclostridium sordellii TaxID=1505 RepID=UPI0030D4FFB3
MSLTKEQVKNTTKEFKQNLKLSELSLEEIAYDLKTDKFTIENIINLNVNAIEDPWILKNYLIDKIKKLGKEPIPFSALVGDYHNYWFLNSKKIDEKRIGI